MDGHRDSRARALERIPSLRTVVIFTLFLASWWAYYTSPLQSARIPGYFLVVSYNTLELLRPAALDSSVYWWFFPVYLYLLAAGVSWLISAIDQIGE